MLSSGLSETRPEKENRSLVGARGWPASAPPASPHLQCVGLPQRPFPGLSFLSRLRAVGAGRSEGAWHSAWHEVGA